MARATLQRGLCEHQGALGFGDEQSLVAAISKHTITSGTEISPERIEYLHLPGARKLLPPNPEVGRDQKQRSKWSKISFLLQICFRAHPDHGGTRG